MAGLRETLYSTQARRPSRSLEDTLYGPSLAVNPDDYEQAAIQNTGDFGRGLSSALTGSVSSVQRYLGANEAARANQQEAARWAPEIQTTDQVHGVGDAIRYGLGATGEGVGSILPAVFGGVAGRALAGARGAYLGSTLGYQPVMAGSHMQDLDANSATAGMSEGDKRLRASGVGLVQAAVEGAGPGYMINRLAKPQALVKAGFGPAVGRAGKVLATDAALEGGGAAVSDIIGQGSIMQLDPTTAYNLSTPI